MSTTLYKRSVTLLIAGFAFLAQMPQSHATHSWGGYHWARTSNPFTLKLGDNLTAADWKGYLAQASSDWNSPNAFGWLSTPVLQTAIVIGQSKRNCSMVKGTTQVCNSKYGANGWLGLASINITGTHITQGTAKMNDTYFNSTFYNNPNEKLHVICQEVAHTFGLAHQSEDGSSLNTCMDYFSNTGANATNTVSTRPNYHDFEELNEIYGHLDGTSTVAASTATGAAAAEVDISDDPNSWGVLMRQSANGRSSIYERFNRDGSKTVTHVTWTVEAATECPSCDHRYQNHGRN